jgi:ribosomal protein S18 acetylase RimI-like enzyme
VNLSADAWLARQLGRDAFCVELSDGHPGDAAASLPALSAHRDAHPRAMYYGKVATTAVDAVEALSRVGFYVVDVNVTFARAASAPAVRSDPRFTVTCATDDGAGDVLEIAASAFRYSRFHLDPAIPIETANRLKRAWIESYLQKSRGDRLLVAIDERGMTAGFLAALLTDREGATVAVIDLIGVRSHCQRSGAGTALVAAFCRAYADRCDRFEVGTQAANVPSLRFYHRLGFDVAATTYVLHMHAPLRR